MNNEKETSKWVDQNRQVQMIRSMANAYIFMAKNCRKTGEQHLDETEYLNVVKHTADEIESMIFSG